MTTPTDTTPTNIPANTRIIKDDQGIIRDEYGRWLKGVSGNPKGKPRGAISITARLRQELEKIPQGKKISYLEALIKIILDKALVEKDEQMIKTIWAYLDGLPKQTVEHGFEETLEKIKIEIVKSSGNSENNVNSVNSGNSVNGGNSVNSGNSVNNVNCKNNGTKFKNNRSFPKELPSLSEQKISDNSQSRRERIK